jgi:tRNA A37 threonylcarbamoyladenosine dehydratase
MLSLNELCFTKNDLSKVASLPAAIAGFGGVGAITAELLARWGVLNFRLLYKDIYEPSNLNRQVFSTSRTIGTYKVEVAEERIKEINPYAKVEMSFAERVQNANVHRFIEGADIVIQTADHPSCKLFYLAAREYKVPLVNGYATLTGAAYSLSIIESPHVALF